MHLVYTLLVKTTLITRPPVSGLSFGWAVSMSLAVKASVGATHTTRLECARSILCQPSTGVSDAARMERRDCDCKEMPANKITNREAHARHTCGLFQFTHCGISVKSIAGRIMHRGKRQPPKVGPSLFPSLNCFGGLWPSKIENDWETFCRSHQRPIVQK